MNNKRKEPRSAAWYALRRTLPPWSFEANLAEVEKQLPRYRVDELIVKVDVEEFSHGQVPLDYACAYQRNLYRIKEALGRIGVVYSINPWITLGHTDGGRRGETYVPGLQTMVGPDGTVSTACACPLSKAWRAHTARVWTLYTETRPHVLWVEDDIRTFNHGPVGWGCFCETHLAVFGQGGRAGHARAARHRVVPAR